jgi:hypothetical protein
MPSWIDPARTIILRAVPAATKRVGRFSDNFVTDGSEL